MVGYDFHGNPVTAMDDGFVVITESGRDGYAPKQFTIVQKGGRFQVNGKIMHNKATASYVPDSLLNEQFDNSIENARGNVIETESSSDFGYTISLKPSVSAKATVLNVNIDNSSMIGYKANGEPRIQKGASVNSDFMIANKGTKLVIGGVEKRSVVSVSGGIPLLKDLPVLGWLFSTERESTKKSQLVVVAEVLPVPVGETYSQTEKDEIKKIGSKLQKAGESNTFGYRQYLLDPER